jgi:hypothetical protein
MASSTRETSIVKMMKPMTVVQRTAAMAPTARVGAPPVYRPGTAARTAQLAARGLQSAPPVYRPEEPKILQRSSVSAQVERTGAPPVYSPQEQSCALPKADAPAPAPPVGKAPAVYRPQSVQVPALAKMAGGTMMRVETSIPRGTAAETANRSRQPGRLAQRGPTAQPVNVGRNGPLRPIPAGRPSSPAIQRFATLLSDHYNAGSGLTFEVGETATVEHLKAAAQRMEPAVLAHLKEQMLFDLDRELRFIIQAPTQILAMRMDRLEDAAAALTRSLLERYPMKSAPVKKKAKPKAKKTFLSLAPDKDRRAEFAKLAPSGTINPFIVRFSQEGCTAFYQAPFNDKDGNPITGYHGHVAALNSEKISPGTTPAITITCYSVDENTWEIVSVDNRRLKVHREANKPIKYVKKEWSQLTLQQQAHFDGKVSGNLHVR